MPKGAKKSGKKHEDADSVFLLGKELAHDTARGQVDRLANALGKMTKADAKKWGNSIESVAGNGATVSGKVCGPNGTSGTKCGQTGSNGTNGKISTAISAEDATLLSADTTNINTQGMANNINTLTKEEKAIVAGAFARVEGAEIAEIRAIGQPPFSIQISQMFTLIHSPSKITHPLHSRCMPRASYSPLHSQSSPHHY